MSTVKKKNHLKLVPKTTAAPTPIEETFNQNDFSSIEIKFEIENLTTHTKIKGNAEVAMIEFSERELVLSLPPKSCANGHHVLVKVKTITPEGKPLQFDVTCKVEKIQATEENDAVQTKMTLMQFSETEWARFREIFSRRQNEILNFFSSAKGY